MFAGHMMLLVFMVGGEFLLFHGAGLVKAVGPIAWLLAIAISFLELLIQCLQAYIFTALTANYIGGALSDEH
jgi:F-type H+-transporting ATPase subunit a